MKPWRPHSPLRHTLATVSMSLTHCPMEFQSLWPVRGRLMPICGGARDGCCGTAGTGSTVSRSRLIGRRAKPWHKGTSTCGMATPMPTSWPRVSPSSCGRASEAKQTRVPLRGTTTSRAWSAAASAPDWLRRPLTPYNCQKYRRRGRAGVDLGLNVGSTHSSRDQQEGVSGAASASSSPGRPRLSRRWPPNLAAGRCFWASTPRTSCGGPSEFAGAKSAAII